MSIYFKPKNFLDKFISKRKKVYEGYRKTLFEGKDPFTFVMHFKDNDPDFPGRASLDHRISEELFQRIGHIGIDHHFKKRINMYEQSVFQTQPFPFRVVIHNILEERLASILDAEVGTILPTPIIEVQKKVKQDHYALITENHIYAMGWASEDEMEIIHLLTRRLNDFLRGQFIAHGFKLGRLDLEFGRLYHPELGPEILLIDELSPHTFNLWDNKNHQPLIELHDHKKQDVYMLIAEKLGILSEKV